MDGAKWAKFCRDTGLQNKKTFTSMQVDIVFSKVKAKGERKIRFEEFKDACPMVAEMKAGPIVCSHRAYSLSRLNTCFFIEVNTCFETVFN